MPCQVTVNFTLRDLPGLDNEWSEGHLGLYTRQLHVCPFPASKKHLLLSGGEVVGNCYICNPLPTLKVILKVDHLTEVLSRVLNGLSFFLLRMCAMV